MHFIKKVNVCRIEGFTVTNWHNCLNWMTYILYRHSNQARVKTDLWESCFCFVCVEVLRPIQPSEAVVNLLILIPI